MNLDFRKVFADYFNRYPFFVLDGKLNFFYTNVLAKQYFPEFEIGNSSKGIITIETTEEDLTKVKAASPICMVYNGESFLGSMVPYIDTDDSVYYCIFADTMVDKSFTGAYAFLSSKLAVLNICQYLNKISRTFAKRHLSDEQMSAMYSDLVAKAQRTRFILDEPMFSKKHFYECFTLKSILDLFTENFQRIYFADELKHFTIACDEKEIVCMSPVFAMTVTYMISLVASISTSGFQTIEVSKKYSSFIFSITTEIDGKRHVNERFPQMRCLESPFKLHYFATMLEEFSYYPDFKIEDNKMKVTIKIPIIETPPILRCPRKPYTLVAAIVLMSIDKNFDFGGEIV